MSSVVELLFQILNQQSSVFARIISHSLPDIITSFSSVLLPIVEDKVALLMELTTSSKVDCVLFGVISVGLDFLLYIG